MKRKQQEDKCLCQIKGRGLRKCWIGYVQFQVMQKLQDCFSTIEVPERKDILRETDRYHTDNFMADYVMDASGGIKEVRYDWIKKE